MFTKYLKLNVVKTGLLISSSKSVLPECSLSQYVVKSIITYCLAQKPRSSVTTCPGLPGTCPHFSPDNPVPGNSSVSTKPGCLAISPESHPRLLPFTFYIPSTGSPSKYTLFPPPPPPGPTLHHVPHRPSQ